LGKWRSGEGYAVERCDYDSGVHVRFQGWSDGGPSEGPCLKSADTVEKVFIPGRRKNPSLIGERFKFLAGGTAENPTSPCTTLEITPNVVTAVILAEIELHRKTDPPDFRLFQRYLPQAGMQPCQQATQSLTILSAILYPNTDEPQRRLAAIVVIDVVG